MVQGIKFKTDYKRKSDSYRSLYYPDPSPIPLVPIYNFQRC